MEQFSEDDIVKCPKCGSAAFTEIMTFVKVSAVMSQNGQEGVMPIQSTFICMNCGTSIEDTDAVKSIKNEEKSTLIV